jgi:hypothetical protein
MMCSRVFRVCSLLGRLAFAFPDLGLALGVVNGLKLRGYCLWQRVVHTERTLAPHLRAEPLNPLWLVALHDGQQARRTEVPEKSPKSYNPLKSLAATVENCRDESGKAAVSFSAGPSSRNQICLSHHIRVGRRLALRDLIK